MRNEFTILICAFLFGACTEQRDLFVISRSLLHIENEWEPTKIDKKNGATLLIYNADVHSAEMIPNAVERTLALDKGMYDMLSFNAMMYSEQESHLNYIYYRGTDRFETVEACVAERDEKDCFRPLSDEIVIHHPDILACRSLSGVEVVGDPNFEIKYRDGKDGYATDENHIEQTVRFSPCRITHVCQVLLHTRHPRSAKVVKASLRGFAGSVFLAERMPSHGSVTHQFDLNTLRIDTGDSAFGVLSSPAFTTFGPPLDLPDRRYELDVTVLLVNGKEYGPVIFDITEQVKHCIAYLNDTRANNIPITDTLFIEVYGLELPAVTGDTDVGIEDWGNNVIIIIPIN